MADLSRVANLTIERQGFEFAACRFIHAQAAVAWIDQSKKRMELVEGDDGTIWAVLPEVAARLRLMGFLLFRR